MHITTWGCVMLRKSLVVKSAAQSLISPESGVGPIQMDAALSTKLTPGLLVHMGFATCSKKHFLILALFLQSSTACLGMDGFKSVHVILWRPSTRASFSSGRHHVIWLSS